MQTKTAATPASADSVQLKLHDLSYAYPSSDLAKKVGFSAKGAFVYKSATQLVPFTTYLDAAAFATRQQTAPTRWSKDHPLNAKFLQS
jgi:AraC-like DNA-binding protein